MASVVLTGDTSGQVTLSAPAIAGTNTVTLPAATGTALVLVAGGSWTYSSGTPASIDFTGIPSTVKRITFQFNVLSFAASGVAVIQIGSGSLTTTGYSTATGGASAAGATVSSITNGIGQINTSAAGTTVSGTFVLTNMGGNLWTSYGVSLRPNDNVINMGSGQITLSGTLDRISLVATTSTFDAGTINVAWE